MLNIAGETFDSRLLLGTALFPSPQIMLDAINAAKTQIVTVSLKRQLAGDHHKTVKNTFWELIKSTNCRLLPNTAGCRSAKEAITTAQMAREIFNTPWVKLEVIGDDYNLQPDPFALLEATRELISQGFIVLPYCIDDLIVCEKLAEAGCEVIMPWGAPIGSGQGLLNPFALKTLRQRLKDLTLIVDAGIGTPSHAAKALELGFDAVLLNSAVALSNDPIKMAKAFSLAVDSGRLAYEAGMMSQRDFASPSTPLSDTPFWQQNFNHKENE